MKRGRTIVAKREQLETASERMQAREKVRRKKTLSVISVALVIVILVILGVMAWQRWGEERFSVTMEEQTDLTPTVEIIDEAGVGISSKVQSYVALLEQDFSDLGHKITKVVLPQDKSRELLVNIEGKEGIIKVSLDRGTAVSAEDTDRMLRYLEGQGSDFEYIDVRTEEKGYYK